MKYTAAPKFRHRAGQGNDFACMTMTIRSKPRRRPVLLAGAFFSILLSGAMGDGSGASQGAVAACPSAGTPVAEPYRWYPSLDLARIPFHRADGPWGPRAAIVAPEPPVTQRRVRVSSAARLAAEGRTPGSSITVDAQYLGHVVVAGDVSDLDLVVPAGRTIAQLTIGRFNAPTTIRRVRIRGTAPGSHSGGLIGRITFLAPAADVIIDGVDLNGADGEGGNLLWHFAAGVQRLAVVNVRGHASGPGSLHNGTDIVIAGSRLMTGARPREVNGYPEGWGIRAGDRLVVFDNRIDGTRYHRVRVHPEHGAPQYAWVANNLFVDPHEARIVSAFNRDGRTLRYAAIWAHCNRVYAHSTCMAPSFEGKDANYAMLTSNVFFGSITEELQRGMQAAHGPGRDYLSGNRFSPWQAPPAWDGPGDPTVIPLPPVKESRHNPAQAFKPCPPP